MHTRREMLARSATVPDPPLADRVDLLGGLAPGLADEADEPAVTVLDRRLDQPFDLRVEPAENVGLDRKSVV